MGDPTGMRFALTAGVAVFMALLGTARGEEPQAREAVSEPAIDFVVAHFFPGYGVMPVGELSSETRALTAGDPAYDHPDRSPTSIRADFDGNGFEDYALLIRKPAGPEADRIFIILMTRGEGRFSKAMEAFFGSTEAETYLGYLQPGKVPESAAGAPSPKPAHPAVVLHVGGQPTYVVRWDSGRSEFRILPATSAR